MKFKNQENSKKNQNPEIFQANQKIKKIQTKIKNLKFSKQTKKSKSIQKNSEIGGNPLFLKHF